MANRCWSAEVLSAIDDSDRACGTVRPALAAELGLPEGVLVASGGGDNIMAAIGTGNVQEGVMTVSLGTSGTIYAYSDSPIIDGQGELAARQQPGA